MIVKVASTIIALVLGIVGVTAMMLTYRSDLAANSQEVNKRLLAAEQFPYDQVRKITLLRDGQKYVFERSETKSAAAGGWRQVQPFEYPMDPFSIRQIAALAGELEVIDTIDLAEVESESTIQSLRLDPPLAQVTYEWPKGSTTIKLGRRSVAGRAYVRLGDQPMIYVVSQKLHERAAEMDPREWRDRTIFPNVDIESSRIEWSQNVAAGGAGSKLVMERQRRQWNMLEPARTRIDPVGRDAYLQDLASARVGGFIFDQPGERELSQFGLNEPVATLTITSESSAAAPQRLIVGSRVVGGAQDHYGMLEGRAVVVRLSAVTLGALFRMPQNLVEPTGSGVISADVKSLVIRTPEAELELVRDLERWRAPKADNAEVSTGQVQELLNHLTQTRAPNVDFREYPRDSEVATISLYGFDGKPLDTVRIAKDENTQRWIMENGDNVLRLFPASLKLRLTARDFGL